MRGFLIVIFLFSTLSIKAIDRPLLLKPASRITVRLPEHSEALWIYSSPPLNISIHKTNFVVPVRSIGRGAYSAEVPNLASVVAVRHRINGQWSTIYPAVASHSIDSSLTIFDGEIPDAKVVTSVVDIKNVGEWRVEVVANSLGSQLEPILRVADPKGRELTCTNSGFTVGGDAAFYFTAKTRGDHKLELRDIANGSGANYFFLLSSQQASRKPLGTLLYPTDIVPDEFFAVDGTWWDHPPRHFKIPFKFKGGFVYTNERISFNATSGQKLRISAETRRFGMPADPGLALLDSSGKVIAESVGEGANGPSITNRIQTSGRYQISVREIAKRKADWMNYWLSVEEISPGVILTSEVEKIEFTKEGEAKVKIRCERYDFDGPVKLFVEGLPEIVSTVENSIPENKTEGELKLKANGKFEAFNIRIIGKIEHKETKGTKSFPVSTMPALRKLYPLMMFPSAAMDGWIAVNPPE